MKRVNTISAITLFVIAGCVGCKQSGTQSDDFITVDVTASYPKKELILQEFMDVEYIPLETTDEFVSQGLVQAIGKDVILATNHLHINDGDIFIFDRKSGKALKKINRKGNGGEEYTRIFGIILDEDNGEMFVNNMPAKKILVYDLDGKFKRSFRHKEGVSYFEVYNFDRENLICHDGYYSNDGAANRQSFMIISKQDGSITGEIQIPFKEKIIATLISKDEVSQITYSISPDHHPIIPYRGNWLLVEPSSDTVYRYLPNHTMKPFIARTPSVRSMDPPVFLFPGILTDRYYFMESAKKVYDFETGKGFPGANLMYDKQEKALFEYTVYNEDYSNKKQIYMKTHPVNDEIATWQNLEAHRLVEAYEKGELKGRLKDIAAGLDEDSNPVILLIKHKR
jgi:hypothetical protein